jgi:hypothetical protein
MFPTRTAFSIIFLAQACGCFSLGRETPTESTLTTKQDLTVPAPKVQKVWQEMMVNQLDSDKSPYSEAWGLFSEGGWADAGQTMVFINKAYTAAWVVQVNPGSKDQTEPKQLDEAAWNKLKETVSNSEDLNDIDVTSFDGLVFEFVKARRDASAHGSVIKRTYINTGGQPSARHEALIGAFQAVRVAEQKK